MPRFRQLLSGLGILATGIVGLGLGTAEQARAQEPTQLTQAEIACEAALLEGTIEALEEYLRLYPSASTACRALALNALSDFGGGPDGPANVVPPSGGYGG